MRTRSVSTSIGPKLTTIPCKKFANLLRSPYKRRKTVCFQTLRHASSATSRVSGRRRMSIFSCASGFHGAKSLRKQEEGETNKVTTKGAKDIQYVHNPFASMVSIEGPLSVADSIREPVPNPSPATVSMCVSLSRIREDTSLDKDAEAACRSFENYLVEMIVEEGKVRDLMDVEELVKCWGELKNPLFADMVFEFYVEMCEDLFLCQKQELDDDDSDDDEDDANQDDSDDNNDDDNDVVETKSCPRVLNL